ncbi:MAG: hypothetical protein ACSLFL_09250 [Alphaproteobacteria bacterium]
MSENPDHEFDGCLHTKDGQNLLCDIQVWLPRSPSADAKVQVVVMGVNAHDLPQGLVSLTSDKLLEAQGFRFSAKEVLIRRATSHSTRRKAGGAKLTIGHVGSWTVKIRRLGNTTGPDNADATTKNTIVKSVDLILSSLNYAQPQVFVTVDYKGNRTIKEMVPPRVLRFANSSGEILCAWELQRHWHWAQSTGDEISASSSPVLHLADSKNHRTTLLGREELVQMGDDACVLLSLAARHRVAVHTINSFTDSAHAQEWRYPLQRVRAITEEEACGPLIGEEELECYFEHATRWWSGLTEIQKDSVRLAVFAINPITDSAMESRFLSMFTALDGLTKRWGKGRHFCSSFSAMVQTYPVQIGGLWPVCGGKDEKSLYWLRNEIAHGGSVMRFAPGALPLASDHLQLWLEHVLLALMQYGKQRHYRDWLTDQVFKQNDEVKRMMLALHEQDSGAA